MRNFLKSTVILSLVVLASSCYKEPTFDLKPQIEFSDIEKMIRIDLFSGANKDSVIIALTFQDGDGDLGLSETEKAIAQESDDYNYIVTSFEKQNGTFVETPPLIPLSGYFPQLKLDNKEGPIEGTLFYTVEFLHPFTPVNDTVKFSVQLKDRAGNLSNAVETDEVILNQVR